MIETIEMIDNISAYKRKPVSISPQKPSAVIYENHCTTTTTTTTAISPFIDRFICGDSLETMRQFPDKSIDLVITSPPYNLKNSSGNGMRDAEVGNGGTLDY